MNASSRAFAFSLCHEGAGRPSQAFFQPVWVFAFVIFTKAFFWVWRWRCALAGDGCGGIRLPRQLPVLPTGIGAHRKEERIQVPWKYILRRFH